MLTTDTGFERNYDSFAYGLYEIEHNSILFPIANTDNRLKNKQRVHGIIDSDTADMNATVKVFVIDRFGEDVNLVSDRIGNNNYLIVGSSDMNFATSFKLEEGKGASLQFKSVEDQLPIILKDNEGNNWDIFGFATDGPRRGDRLGTARSYTGYWFAWADFFPRLEIYDNH